MTARDYEFVSGPAPLLPRAVSDRFVAALEGHEDAS
jgi:hypothetical protein